MSERIKRYEVKGGIGYINQCAVPTTWVATRDDGEWCRSTDVDAIEAENERLIKTLGSPLRFHCCTEGRIRPYPASICSVAPHDESCSFDPVSEIARLRRIVEAARPILDRIRNAGTVRELGAGGQTIDQNLARQERRGVFSVPENMFREWEEACASDAAKAQQHAKGEKAT
jgi:hypothetical protein